ncbi:oligosaccharide flippase family protein [Thalassotalea eurytherma]|uniref:Lipopolysaccharide biosynthesis protein n=1 Tax=Thalassotalea eurytherma TaxID=1144278 RepID=A0ABQ6H1R6_9GAMM|nr:oligosaccharide flippase family protein [Thalassotalea eurytherma]GLX82095.1 lipopolysaccharide biosynthesis protein [Thalassotalea eurytherma]
MSAKLINSALLSSGAQFLNKLLGLISTLILARILTPEDFALIALVSITLYFFDVLSNAGSEQYLIQKTRVTFNDLNTAWSLDVLIKSIIFILVVIFAHPIAMFMEQPEISLAIIVASSVLIIQACKPPQLILLKRQLNYALLFKLSLLQKITSFMVVIPSALYLKNFWAFIIADIVATAIYVGMAYMVIGKRPKFRFTEVKNQWLFSKWLLAKSVLGYMRSQVDTIIVSKHFSSTILGNYHIARDISMMPGHYLLAPAIEPLLASFSQLKTKTKKFFQHFCNVTLVISLLSGPIAVFILFNADLIITVLLGKQWLIAQGILQVFAFLFLYWVYWLLVEQALVGQGKVKLLFWFDFISLALTIFCLLVLLSQRQQIVEVAVLRVVTGIFLTFFALMYLLKNQVTELLKVIAFISWPLLVSLMVALILQELPLLDNAVADLLLKGASYFTLLGGLFFLLLACLKHISVEHKLVYEFIKMKLRLP